MVESGRIDLKAPVKACRQSLMPDSDYRSTQAPLPASPPALQVRMIGHIWQISLGGSPSICLPVSCARCIIYLLLQPGGQRNAASLPSICGPECSRPQAPPFDGRFYRLRRALPPAYHHRRCRNHRPGTGPKSGGWMRGNAARVRQPDTAGRQRGLALYPADWFPISPMRGITPIAGTCAGSFVQSALPSAPFTPAATQTKRNNHRRVPSSNRYMRSARGSG